MAADFSDMRLPPLWTSIACYGILKAVRCYRKRYAVSLSHHPGRGILLFPSQRGGMLMYITLAELLQYTLVVLSIIGLVLTAIKKK